jgi:hypothetical protein
MTPHRVRVSFKHEDAGAWVGGEFVEREPTGKIHVYREDRTGEIATFWGSITEARRLAEVIGAEFNDY